VHVSEFVSHAILKWIGQANIKAALNDSGKPWHDGSDESGLADEKLILAEAELLRAIGATSGSTNNEPPGVLKKLLGFTALGGRTACTIC
jgi:hypothetical protein